MTYEKLVKDGTKVFERDSYNNGIWLYTTEYWIFNKVLYIHEKHSNNMQYTGETKTYQSPIYYAKFLITDYLPVDIAEKINELTDYM